MMHRELMFFPDSLKIDHINLNGIDNRRANLRVANNSQNVAHARKTTNCSSKYKGVHWHKGISKWVARITVSGLEIQIGCFSDEGYAARAYDTAAMKHFGEFALTNKSMNLI